MTDEASPDDSDELLLTRIAAERDERALSILISRHAPKLKGHLTGRFRNTLQWPEIDLAIQKTFMKVWHKADRYYASKATVSGWLIAIAHKTAIDIHRHEKVRRGVGLNDDDLPFSSADDCDDERSEATTVNAWRLQQLEDIIENDLKGLQQAVARADLASGGDLDIARLASQHNTTQNSVAVTRTRVRQKILKIVQEREAQRNRPKGRT